MSDVGMAILHVLRYTNPSMLGLTYHQPHLPSAHRMGFIVPYCVQAVQPFRFRTGLLQL